METKELTNALLKEKMTDAMVSRRILTASDDLNDIKQTGVYIGDAVTPINTPEGCERFILTVTQCTCLYADKYVKQEVMANTGICYQRMFWWNVWHPWRKIVMEALA